MAACYRRECSGPKCFAEDVCAERCEFLVQSLTQTNLACPPFHLYFAAIEKMTEWEKHDRGTCSMRRPCAVQKVGRVPRDPPTEPVEGLARECSLRPALSPTTAGHPPHRVQNEKGRGGRKGCHPTECSPRGKEIRGNAQSKPTFEEARVPAQPLAVSSGFIVWYMNSPYTGVFCGDRHRHCARHLSWF
jgi:hypothetical protein